MSAPNAHRSQPPERDLDLPLAAKPVLERLGAASIEYQHIRQTMANARAAFDELERAIEANRLGHVVAAADKLAKAGDLQSLARIFARAADRLLSKEGGKR